jgi:hypothetical protein
MISSDDFPRLTEQNYRVTSPATPDYNCIAWSAGVDIEHDSPDDVASGIYGEVVQFMKRVGAPRA